MNKGETRKVWLVPHPTDQFNEDVKALARKNHLIIIDAAFRDDIDPDRVEEDTPKLTLRNPAKKTRAKRADQADDSGEGESGNEITE